MGVVKTLGYNGSVVTGTSYLLLLTAGFSNQFMMFVFSGLLRSNSKETRSDKISAKFLGSSLDTYLLT